MSERCQALLLMPNSRSWMKGGDVRCKWNAKPDNNFCGVHKKLGLLIETIIWKEDHGS